MRGLLTRRLLFGILALMALGIAGRVEAQRRGFDRGFSNARLARPDDFDGGFQFCRVVFASRGRYGSSWEVDYPRADINLSIRLSELTTTNVSRSAGDDPKHVLVRLTDPELFSCPFIMMTEVGSAYFTREEARQLREYLLKGGFLWADDFWGSDAWAWWQEQIQEVFPDGDHPIVDLQPPHPLFQAQFVVKKTPQIASINFWSRNGGSTSERFEDSADVHTRAILNAHGEIMVLMTHNTDLGDSFEREGDDPTYFRLFSIPGYAFGINALLYAMTH